MNMDINQNVGSNYIKKQLMELIPGDKIIKSIYRSDGLMLISENKILDERLINIIQRQARPNTTVFVAMPQGQGDNPFGHNDTTYSSQTDQYNYHNNQFINAETSYPRVTPSSNNFNNTNPFTNVLSSSPYWVFMENKLDSVSLKSRVNSVKKELLTLLTSDYGLVNLIHRISDYDELLLVHCINTSCIAIMLGMVAELKNEELIDLAIAAMFSNIGYIELPREIFRAMVKTHQNNHPALKKHIEVFVGMNFDSPILRKRVVVQGILDHHEYYNGSGLPMGKVGEEISLYGRIIQIAHNYDDLVRGFETSNGMLPFEAIRTIHENSEGIFDKDILNIFLHRTTYFKQGEIVSFPNGVSGKIIGFHDYVKYPHLPMVQFINGSIIDLFYTKMGK